MGIPCLLDIYIDDQSAIAVIKSHQSFLLSVPRQFTLIEYLNVYLVVVMYDVVCFFEIEYFLATLKAMQKKKLT